MESHHWILKIIPLAMGVQRILSSRFVSAYQLSHWSVKFQ